MNQRRKTDPHYYVRGFASRKCVTCGLPKRNKVHKSQARRWFLRIFRN